MDRDKLISDVKKFVQDINKKYPIELAYIFGSIARGNFNAMSDVDIALKFKNNYNNLEDVFIRGEIIDSAQGKLDVNLDVVSLNRATIFLKYQVVKDGILIIDSDERSDFESLVLREYFDFKYYSDIYDTAFIKNLKEKGILGG